MAQASDSRESQDGSCLRLSGRETEILVLIAEGHRSTEVAEKLFLSKRTVDFHLANVFWKLGVNNRIQAILAANRLGLIPYEPSDLTEPIESNEINRGFFPGGPGESPANQERLFDFLERRARPKRRELSPVRQIPLSAPDKQGQ